jgi:hypothetical protein
MAQETIISSRSFTALEPISELKPLQDVPKVLISSANEFDVAGAASTIPPKSKSMEGVASESYGSRLLLNKRGIFLSKEEIPLNSYAASEIDGFLNKSLSASKNKQISASSSVPISMNKIHSDTSVRALSSSSVVSSTYQDSHSQSSLRPSIKGTRRSNSSLHMLSFKTANIFQLRRMNLDQAQKEVPLGNNGIFFGNRTFQSQDCFLTTRKQFSIFLDKVRAASIYRFQKKFLYK